MTVLVSAASKHGSTAEIATAVARVLQERGLAVDVRPVENVTLVDGYEAVVLGSAVYAGHWMESARRLAEVQAGALASRPVWLFSSGRLATRRSRKRIRWTCRRSSINRERATTASSPAKSTSTASASRRRPSSLPCGR